MPRAPTSGGRPTVTLDGTPPVVTCPADVTVPADAGGCTAMLAPPLVGVLDTCDRAPSIACVRDDMLAVGDPDPTGDTIVTYTATDSTPMSGRWLHGRS